MTPINNKRRGISLLVVASLIVVLVASQRPDYKSGSGMPYALQKPKSTTAQNPDTGTTTHPMTSNHRMSNRLVKVSQPQSNSRAKIVDYLSNQQSGIIGLYDGKQIDNPADNIFTVKMDNLPAGSDRVWLTYKLTGVEDYSNIACSINDRLAMGGYLAKKSNETNRQRVQLDPAWLQKGENRIQFGLPENADYGYKVEDLVLEVEQGTNDAPLAVNAGTSLYNGKAYIHGFVQNAKGDKATVSIDGKTVNLRDGEFETIVEHALGEPVEVKAVVSGKPYIKEINFTNNTSPDQEFALNEKCQKAIKSLEKGKADSLEIANVSLKVDEKSLLTNQTLSVTSLRDMDLPALDMGMYNVTDKNKGVRFLPHGEHFSQPATVSLKYDRTKIPDGYTENDIKTFYFDTRTNHWVALERDTVDKATCSVISKTTHFTDMINGVIKTPESPETQGFTPTQMNDIKAADPTSKIELIAPPTANNQGSANLSYPLELPPVRNGISPQLAIQYNSDGGSGWLGEGWDLNVPSITVDTRWGVPRYDPKYETETYNMGGVKLATVIDTSSANTDGIASVGHKGVLYERFIGLTDEGVQFHPVSENCFSRITRLGKTPGEYYWKVVTKEGITYTYGEKTNNCKSTLEGQVNTFEYGSDGKTKQAKTKSAIAEWRLSSVQDQYRNFCRYYYTNVSYPIHGSNVSAKSIQLSRIEVGRLKKNTPSDTIYQVVDFVGKTPRLKRTSSARYGFLTTNDTILLDTIKIRQYNPDNTLVPVRSYAFGYSNGAFSSKLLSKLSHCDSLNREVASHTFNYYNNTASGYYQTEETLNTTSVEQGDNNSNTLKATTAGLPALGGTKSNSTSGSFSIGVGVSSKILKFLKIGGEAGVGYNYSTSKSSSDSKMMMVDINGDGLPDKVYKGSYYGSNCLCFIPNLGNGQFGNCGIPISGYNGDFSFTSTSSHTNGWRGSASVEAGNKANVTVEAGMDWLSSSSETPTYLSDVNSDGLIDIVSHGAVHFNTISSYSNGVAVPSFSTNSGLTPRPILNIKSIKGKAGVLKLSDRFMQTPVPSQSDPLSPVVVSDNPIQRDSSIVLREKIEDYDQVPMQDIVRVWEAPRSGSISILTYIKYLGDTTVTGTDGVRLAIQTGGVEIWNDSIKPKDSSLEKNTINHIDVTAGQRIYFRLQSGSNNFSDYLEDVVLWKQTVTYTDIFHDHNTPKDIDGYDILDVYNSSEGSFVSQQFENVVDSVDSDGTVTVDGLFSKPNTTDSVFLKIYASTDSLLSRDSTVMTLFTDSLTGITDTSSVKFKIWEPNPNYFPEELVWQKAFGKEAETINNMPIDYWWLPECPVHVRFEISSNTNLQWDKIKWRPELHYQHKGTGRDTIFYAGVKYNIFERKCHDQSTQGIPVNIFVPYNNTPYIDEPVVPTIRLKTKRKINTNYTLVVYDYNNNQVAKFYGRIENNANRTENFVISTLPPGSYYLAVNINDTISQDSVTATCHFQHESTNEIIPYIYCHQQPSRNLFGHMWRGWGQFQYNAGNGRYAEPIIEDSLFIPNDTTQQSLANNWGVKKMCLFNMNHKPYKSSYYWTGSNDHLLIMGDTICTGRLNIVEMPTILSPELTESSQTTQSSPNRVSPMRRAAGATPILSGTIYEIKNAPAISNRSKSTTSWGGATVDVGKFQGGGNYSWSNGQTNITSSFMDMNGDGYPDYITDTQVEYTNPNGGRDGEVSAIEGEKSNNDSKSFGFSGGYTASLSSSSISVDLIMPNADLISMNLSKDMNASFGVNCSHSTNNTVSTLSYIDLNGDGLPDRVYMQDKKVYVCLNQGYGFSNPIDWGLANISLTKSSSNSIGASAGVAAQKELMIAVTSQGGTVVKYLKKLNVGVNLGVNTVGTTNYSLFSLFDVNMDGLPDKVYRSSSNKIAVEFNTGNGFGPAITMEEIEELYKSHSSATSGNLSLSVSFRILIFFKISLGATGSLSWATDYTLNQMMDIDGDGYPDVVKANDSSNRLAELKVKRSLIGYTNKLKSVTNPLGGKMRLEYARTQASFDHPGGKWVMSAVSANDGISDDGDSLMNKFTYSGGKYDRYEREFLGYSDVVTENINTATAGMPAYRKMRQTFDNSNYYTRGALLGSVVSGVDGSTESKYSETANKYYAYSVSRLAHAADTAMLGKYRLSAIQPEEELTRENMFLHQYIVYTPLKYNKNTAYAYTEGAQSSMATSESYSEYNTATGTHGELTLYKFSDKGSLGENGTGGYNYKTEISYLTNKPLMTLFALPTAVTVTGSDGKLYRRTEAVWNDNFASQLKQIRNVIVAGDTATTTLGYDAWGNISQKELPGKVKADRMWYSYKYDNFYHLFPTEVSDHFGYTSKLEDYDYRYGVPRKTTDINGNVMTTTLDNLGRVTSIKGPNDPDYTLKFEYHPQATTDTSGITVPAYAVTKHYDGLQTGSDKELETVTFVDGMGRPVQVKKEGYVDSQPVMIVSGRAKYDAFGRVNQAYYPVTEPMSNKLTFNRTFDNVAPTRTTYDVLDRVLSVADPKGDTTSNAYSINNGLLKTIVTDAEGHSQATFANGSGQTVRTEQYHNGETIVTTFEYDPVNQLHVVTDAKGGKTVSEYDMAGRRTQVTHPASGTTKFYYDAAGNLTGKQTANLLLTGDTITYKYDYNRLKSINYPKHPENNVSYTYGAAGAESNRAGRLVLQTDGSGAQEFRYGKMGEITEVKRTLVIPNQAVATYTTNWTYDSWNRVQTMTYPDGEMLTYNYNTGGLLSGLSGTKGGDTYTYLSNIGYDKFEQRTYMRYGNGAETNYTYDPLNRHLGNLKVHVGNADIMNNTYTYDNVSNVKSVTNTGAAANGLGGAMVHNYGYDDLYRLSTANGTFTGANGKTANYTLAMSYDNLHNITSKKQDIQQTGVQFAGTLKAGYNLSYAYANNPQQISNIADTSYRTESTIAKTAKLQNYSYDANGNLLCVITGTKNTDGKLIRNNERKLLWDEENRLLALSDNGFVSNYWYDAAGERTVKESGDGEGVSVNGVLSAGRTGTTNFTAYISPYLVVSNGGYYSKHIYMGSQRITSKLGSSDIFASSPVNTSDQQSKYADQTSKIKTRYDSLGVVYRGTPQGSAGLITSAAGRIATPLKYFYHSDHLGSSSLITNADGNVTQHIEYVPFGEVFVEERNNSWSTPYKFNAKELDEETGLYYYGARYYNPRSSVWLSVDPLAEKYPNISPYVYCLDNPVKYVDPDGRWVASVFLQGNIGGGLGYGLYAVQQSGIAYDKYGTSHFQMTGTAHITNQDLRGNPNNQNIVWGADAGISAGASIDWKSNSFVESLTGPNQASIPTGKPSFKVAAGVGVSGNENSFSLSAGLQYGATINSMGMKVDESVSLTKSEASKINNMTDVVTESWTVRNVGQQFDKNGNVTGYSGTVFTKDSNGKYINTGVSVNCGTVKGENNKANPNNIWMSNAYQNAVNGNK